MSSSNPKPNYLPLVLAIVFGLAVVVMVKKYLGPSGGGSEKESLVVAAARDLPAGTVIDESAITKRAVPVSAMHGQSVDWLYGSEVVGQKTTRDIRAGEYVLYADVDLTTRVAETIGEGEWAVTLDVNQSGVARILQPGDEIAIIATMSVKNEIVPEDLSQKTEIVEKESTVTLFPRVRVLQVLGAARGGASAVAQVVVALPPQEAQFFIAAKRKADISIALRRAGDRSTTARTDVGQVNDGTFARAFESLDSVNFPVIPAQASN